MNDQLRLILTFSCPDVAGIQAAVTTSLFEAGAFIEEDASYGDPETKRFFGRMVVRASDGASFAEADIAAKFAPIGERFGMDWRLSDASRACPTVIAVSRFGHSLNDLLHRWSTGALKIDIRAVISNHEEMRPLVEWYGLPYHHLPVSAATKAAQEAAFYQVVEEAGAELVVLARYMQVLSDDLSEKLAGRCINIHHSFLPSFKGARPYHQAHKRGVKIIGATAHYVTANLDEGPIIEQGIERVDHTMSGDDLVNIGRDIECTVLARAVKWHAERRILMNGQRTVVFR